MADTCAAPAAGMAVKPRRYTGMSSTWGARGQGQGQDPQTAGIGGEDVIAVPGQAYDRVHRRRRPLLRAPTTMPPSWSPAAALLVVTPWPG
jgi:hypothetical protein